MEHGFSSLFGVPTLIGKYSKEALDAAVKSSFCQGCNIWKNKKEGAIDDCNECHEEHKGQCMVNYVDGAGKMEVDAIMDAACTYSPGQNYTLSDKKIVYR